MVMMVMMVMMVRGLRSETGGFGLSDAGCDKRPPNWEKSAADANLHQSNQLRHQHLPFKPNLSSTFPCKL